MSSSASTATWLPAAIARPAAPSSPRHLAPGAETEHEAVFAALAETDDTRRGRHAEPAWGRELFDPRRDGDPLAWLGFDRTDD
ncbi:MAG: hypothetical protein JWQ45_2036 [Blastococcus sp.]|jgi:hypothetical protein|nr:hypothetical protein [Blastococcus sp.]